MANQVKRIEELENIITPANPIKWVRVIQGIGETREQALARAGLTDKNGVWLDDQIQPIVRRITEPKPENE